MRRKFTVIVEQDDTGFVVECLDFQGCYSQGDTFEEALTNIRDVIQLHLARGESPAPTNVRGVALSTVDVEA